MPSNVHGLGMLPPEEVLFFLNGREQREVLDLDVST
jgi:hypothetical protein